MADDVDRSAPRPLGAGRDDEMTHALGAADRRRGAFDLRRLEWFDLRNMLTVARTIAAAALARTESRGAHQREDFPGMLAEWRLNQAARWSDGHLVWSSTPRAPELAAQ
jgi:succinate dehydrogenase/fumarate reductase flavoprotein subunit